MLHRSAASHSRHILTGMDEIGCSYSPQVSIRRSKFMISPVKKRDSTFLFRSDCCKTRCAPQSLRSREWSRANAGPTCRCEDGSSRFVACPRLSALGTVGAAPPTTGRSLYGGFEAVYL